MSQVQFFAITAAQYAAIEAKDDGALYFLTDANRIYKGTVPYSHPIELVSEFPVTGLVGTLYVNSATKEAKAWNGAAWITVQLAVSTTVADTDTAAPTCRAVKNFVEAALGDYVNGATFDGATGLLMLQTSGGTPIAINLPVEQFLAAAAYDAETHTLTLTMTDGTITANVKISTETGNLAEIKSDGVFVAPLIWQTIGG